jgi:hypothetical protein
MNKNALILAVVFLVASLIVPVYVIYEEANSTLKQLVQEIPNLYQHDTATQDFLNTQAQRQSTVFAVVFIAEIALIACFAVFMWYAIRCTKADQCRAFPTP